MKILFSVTEKQGADVEALGRALSAHNDEQVGAADKRNLSILADDENDKMVAGLSGYTAWGWLYIRWLWVNPTLRARGIARALLEHAETEAKARGCIGAHIDTFSPKALSLYERNGYQVFGELPDFVAGQTRSFLQKRWGRPGEQ